MIILPLMKLPIIYGSNETNQNSEAPSDNSSRFQNTSNENNSEQSASPIETEIASFTTKIYTKDSDRQNNISITCSSLNDTTIENGQTFSFCNTVGKATSSKGYKKADVFQDGEKIEALGRWQLPSKFYLI
ncbi:MAG: VanW family protein [Clostridia bacterium]